MEFLKLPFEHIFSSDIVPAIRTFIEANFSPQILYPDLVGRDLEQMIKDVGDIDVYVAGFPCQPFSSAGIKKGFADKRGKVFFKIADMLEKLQPKVFVLENVSGLVRGADFVNG
jgi:DNA (cytosine-5)-methyltransferase 1